MSSKHGGHFTSQLPLPAPFYLLLALLPGNMPDVCILMLSAGTSPTSAFVKRTSELELAETAKRAALDVSSVTCVSWPLARNYLSKFVTATKHCYPSSWRVCAYCGVAPMCQQASTLLKQGGHQPGDTPPYALQSPHLSQQCHPRASDGTVDMTTWNVCG